MKRQMSGTLCWSGSEGKRLFLQKFLTLYYLALLHAFLSCSTTLYYSLFYHIHAHWSSASTHHRLIFVIIIILFSIINITKQVDSSLLIHYISVHHYSSQLTCSLVPSTHNLVLKPFDLWSFFLYNFMLMEKKDQIVTECSTSIFKSKSSFSDVKSSQSKER